MIPTVRAKQLEDLAAGLRSLAAGLMASGHPIELTVHSPTAYPEGKAYQFNQVTARDLLNDAEDFERLATQLRTLYPQGTHMILTATSSEARRVGKGWVRRCNSRGSS